ncbi:MAG TPA: LuxR C-terminal-related transcriptional regulator, partial [Thermoleophilaceae bacterium]
PRAALETGRALFALGRPQQALTVFARVLDTEDDSDPELPGRLRAGHATAEWLIELGNGETRKLPLKPAGNETAGDRALLALHAMEGAIRGTSAADVRGVAEEALARGALLDDETADGLSYYLAVGALAFSEDLQTAEAALTAAVEDAQSRGSVLGFATASHVRAMTILMRGRLLDAAGDARYALAVERHGWRLGMGGARVVLASVEIERGDLEAAQRHLEMAEAAAGEGDPFRLSLLAVRGRHKLLSGDGDGALADFLACGALADRAGVGNPALAPWRSGAGLASAVVGDWGEAERLIEKELSLARAVGAPGAIGRALRNLASIRETGPALEALEAAVETLQGSQAALERAAALVDFGAALRRSGKRRDARPQLKAGLELAQRCGADVLAARALRESNAAGARPRRTALHGEEALTARERQVASLAADGLSNREIAETLVVTVKTVEWHLKHSYRKLGVSSRGQLREALGPVRGEPEPEAGAG